MRIQRSIPTGRTSFRLALVVCLLFTGMANSGCVTTLGYIPEHPKPIADTATITPTYGEVKKWAYDVLDGYDSRATINRNAIYGGALIAAAAVGAIAGLAAFDTGSSALIGIPIGTAFLGSVASIYSSEEKAHIYRLAGEYVKDLITVSDKRIVRRHLAAQVPATVLEEAQKGLVAAQKQLRGAQDGVKIQDEVVEEAREKAKKETDETRKAKLNENVQALEEVLAKAKDELKKAQLVREAAEKRVNYANLRSEAWKVLQDRKSKFEKEKSSDLARTDFEAASTAWKEFSDPETAETFCLREDINDVMRRVEEHKTLLDPKNIAARLQSIRAPQTSTQGTTSVASGATTTQVSPGDLSDLQPPVKSRCDTEI